MHLFPVFLDVCNELPHYDSTILSNLYIYIYPFHDDYLHIGVLRLLLNTRMQPSVGSQFLADHHSIAITEGYISHIRNIPKNIPLKISNEIP